MDTQNNNQNLNAEMEKNDLSRKKYAARIEMENEEEQKRREMEEKIVREREAKETAKEKAEEDKISSEEKIKKEKEAKETEEKEQSRSNATKITKEVEKIKSVGAQINSLRTFKVDMDEMIQEQNISMSRIAMQEETRRRESGEQAVVVKSKNKIYLILSLLFVILGGIAGWYIYAKKTNVPEGIAIVKTETSKPIIYSETKKEIEYSSLARENLLAEIKKEIFTSEIEPGKIKNIILTKKDITGTKKEATSADFLEILNSGIPDELKRSLMEKTSIYSIAPLISEKSGGILFETESYQKAFAGMLKWEKGTMIKDLYEFLTNIVPGENILALGFVDTVLNNQDARILNDLNSQPTIIYGFLNGKTIAIAGSIDSFNELVDRFRNSGN